MIEERYFKSKKCRYYRDGWVWVSFDGTVIAYEVKGRTKMWGWPITLIRYPRKQKLKNGQVYVKARFSSIVYVDLAVATCWCKPKPKDGRYMLVHKDGNLQNNDRRNLSWEPYHYKQSHNNREDVDFWFDNTHVVLTIYKNGTFKQDGSPLSINDFSYDPDTNSYFYRGITTYVHHISGHINGYPVDPDLLMKKAGYVQGDDALLMNPAILHRDMDPLNFSSENLEFVEQTDPRYQNYLDVLTKYRAKREAELVEKSKELG